VAPISAVAAPAPAIPGANAEENPIVKPLGAIISVGCASIGIVVVIAIRADRLRIIIAAVISAVDWPTDTKSEGYLGVGICSGDQQNPK